MASSSSVDNQPSSFCSPLPLHLIASSPGLSSPLSTSTPSTLSTLTTHTTPTTPRTHATPPTPTASIPATPRITKTSRPSATPPATPSPPARRNKRFMSITQTYYLAHKARAKLAHQAARSDHDLRMLVGHANLLDSLMLELAEAEREQESWFNQSVKVSASSTAASTALSSTSAPLYVSPPPSPPSPPPQRDRWDESAVEDSDSDSDSEGPDDEGEYDDDDYYDDINMPDTRPPIARHPLPPISVRPRRIQEDEDEEDAAADNMEDDYSSLGLVRTSSHVTSPPELDHDADSSDEELMPASPQDIVLALPGHDRSLITGSAPDAPAKGLDNVDAEEVDSATGLFAHGFFIPSRSAARLVTGMGIYTDE